MEQTTIFENELEKILHKSPVLSTCTYSSAEHRALDLTGLKACLTAYLQSQETSNLETVFKSIEIYVLQKLIKKLAKPLGRFQTYQRARQLMSSLSKLENMGCLNVLREFVDSVKRSADDTVYAPSAHCWRYSLAVVVASAINWADVGNKCVLLGWSCCQLMGLGHFVNVCCLFLGSAAVLYQASVKNVRLLENLYQLLAKWRDAEFHYAGPEPPITLGWPENLAKLSLIEDLLRKNDSISVDRGWRERCWNQLCRFNQTHKQFDETAYVKSIEGTVTNFLKNEMDANRQTGTPVGTIEALSVKLQSVRSLATLKSWYHSCRKAVNHGKVTDQAEVALLAEATKSISQQWSVMCKLKKKNKTKLSKRFKKLKCRLRDLMNAGSGKPGTTSGELKLHSLTEDLQLRFDQVNSVSSLRKLLTALYHETDNKQSIKAAFKIVNKHYHQRTVKKLNQKNRLLIRKELEILKNKVLNIFNIKSNCSEVNVNKE
ncbi:hypothetical protein T4B_2709 [Trichinella pseudospiralis]|uniref:Nucleolus and neural progenitor protein-like N-terminal domain-containing protein n=1 Tax=Trichinella pseudospiralis TaxID=6337 RepID=A0A0V1EXW4_TRIPS|nr:hypothetical protein T4A_9027 [Trichinella pseudospiralis]KRZ34839.1 hypothetical protein T4B_2709 [Trichinella pseudospiralis]KRZ45982.1 hypothetical protein T4C_3829 [Trichinella pseudospiralis]